MGLREQRLYYEDSYLHQFVSVVEEVRTDDAGTWVRLRQTAFYPTSGGQPYDTGTLGGLSVVQVEADGEGVWHRMDPAQTDTLSGWTRGTPVSGEIDWARRFDLMQQHCGQHILSACFEQLYGAHTSSFHLGDEAASIDLSGAELGPEEVEAGLLAANRWIWRDVPVRARFVTAEEVGRLHLRKAPSVAEDIRIVTIEGLEDNACGGTHPSSTGQVGQILVTRTERMRGGLRVTFVCGARALSAASAYVDLARNLGAALSVGTTEVVDAVASLLEQVKAATRREQALRAELADKAAAELAAGATLHPSGAAVVSASLGDLAEVADLKRTALAVLARLAERVPEAPQRAAALVGQFGGRTHLLVQVEGDGPLAANRWVQAALAAVDGKGGGNAKAAQGSAPVEPSRLLAVLRPVTREG
ncbi:MAG: alanyl-tRNA editing protein [Alicyclobacillus sp.]|nr:alanyl-tRNA editing protein [Alicyclobacillus sp.]